MFQSYQHMELHVSMNQNEMDVQALMIPPGRKGFKQDQRGNEEERKSAKNQGRMGMSGASSSSFQALIAFVIQTA